MPFLSQAVAIVGLLLAGSGSLRAWQSDAGDGTFTNPPLYADYPDPDIIRVGDDFYFATTTFVNTPGLRLLHSRDLVNWEIVGHIVPRLDGRKEYNLEGGSAYRAGIYAPSLRYYNGTFYVAVTPVKQNTRIYYANDIRGPWKYHELDRPAFDPGMFIEADGRGYIITSGGWDGTGTLLTLDKEFARVVSAEKAFYIKGAEGSKVVKRGEWYYLFNSIPSKLAMTVSRAKQLTGPWETKAQIDDHTGGHQGAIVDLPDGSWYGFVMCDSGAVGRMTNISPMLWQDDWPVWGTPEAPGVVPSKARKPIQGQPVMQPATSDDFSSPHLGLQWQWNHNPDDARWSLSERAGFLRLRPTQAADFWLARNTLTQKGQGPWSRGDVKLDLRNLKAGMLCGFGTLGKISANIATTRDSDNRVVLSMRVRNDGVGEEVRVQALPIDAEEIFLRTEMDFVNKRGACAFSVDGKEWRNLGGDFPLLYDWRTGTFQGEQYAIFCYTPHDGIEGYVDVDSFQFSDQRELVANGASYMIKH